MASGQFTFDVISALFISGYLLYSYSNWFRQRIAVTIAVLVAWYFSFLIVLVLPLDVSATAYKQCISANQTVYTQEDPVHVITEHDINSTRSNSSTIPPQTQAPKCKEQCSNVGPVKFCPVPACRPANW